MDVEEKLWDTINKSEFVEWNEGDVEERSGSETDERILVFWWWLDVVVYLCIIMLF